MADEIAERMALVTAASSWCRTRFHHHAAVKWTENDLGGVDCAHLLLESHVEAGLVSRFEAEAYPHDWHMHRDEERFLAKIEEYASRVDDCELPISQRGADFRVLPGNVLMWRCGRTFSHGAIVSLWPNIIHASFPAQCCLEESCLGGYLEGQPMRVYSFWGC